MATADLDAGAVDLLHTVGRQAAALHPAGAAAAGDSRGSVDDSVWGGPCGSAGRAQRYRPTGAAARVEHLDHRRVVCCAGDSFVAGASLVHHGLTGTLVG